MLAAYAQSNVYSVNVVGYVTKTVNDGFTLIANPLIDQSTPSPTINDLIPVAPPGAQVFMFNGTTYEVSTFDDLLEPPAFDNPIVIPPGQGFFISLPTGTGPLDITFVGEVAQREDSNKTLTSGFSMTGSLVPMSAPISVHALPGAPGDQAYKYVPGSGYVVSTFDDLLEPPAYDNDFNLDVAEGIFIRLAGSLPWTRDFVVPE